MIHLTFFAHFENQFFSPEASGLSAFTRDKLISPGIGHPLTFSDPAEPITQ